MTYIVTIIIILVLCYYLSRYLAKKASGIGSSSMGGSKIKIIERVALGQDKGLAICKICTRYYVIGIANESIKILAELDPEHFKDEKTTDNNGVFKDLLGFAQKKKDKNSPQP